MKTWIVLCIFASNIGVVYTCTCLGVPTNGCDSEYSILGFVLGEHMIGSPPDDEIIYTVRVLHVYKAPGFFPRTVQIRAYVEGSLCGLRLRPRQAYVISGFTDEFRLRTNACAFTRAWDEIPTSELGNLFCRRP
ncbi:metalloproteinase inhibitor 3-like [Saccostrea echinata]|uniref:metalloproteinase inhibitor 3-like n=1 Tax=Saccostrea echinata TaxID=191078 RepID=UPI002A7FEEF6|nr:metalloproteinase inhibitor 3-like [Saccostrea echinata]